MSGEDIYGCAHGVCADWIGSWLVTGYTMECGCELVFLYKSLLSDRVDRTIKVMVSRSRQVYNFAASTPH
jgi:hypothetical protein